MVSAVLVRIKVVGVIRVRVKRVGKFREWGSSGLYLGSGGVQVHFRELGSSGSCLGSGGVLVRG